MRIRTQNGHCDTLYGPLIACLWALQLGILAVRRPRSWRPSIMWARNQLMIKRAPKSRLGERCMRGILSAVWRWLERMKPFWSFHNYGPVIRSDAYIAMLWSMHVRSISQRASVDQRQSVSVSRPAFVGASRARECARVCQSVSVCAIWYVLFFATGSRPDGKAQCMIHRMLWVMHLILETRMYPTISKDIKQ